MAADRAAQALGIAPGLAAAHAGAISPDLVTDDADVEGDRAALEKLAHWALRRYAPIASPDAPDGVVIDVTGATHLKGGDESLARDIADRLAAVGVLARSAIAPTWGAAHALARFGENHQLIATETSALPALPIRALRLAPAAVEELDRLGVETIGELSALPRAPLTRRMGPEPLRRLDQAFGRIAEPIDPVIANETVHVRRSFGEPIGAPETLAKYATELAERLCAELETRGLGARIVDLAFHRVDNRIEALRVALAKPMRDAKRLARLCRDRLENVDPGFGVEVMAMTATAAEPLDWKTAPHDLGEAARREVAELVDILANRPETSRLYRVAPAESDVPERSVKKIEALEAAAGGAWPVHWPRPSRLLARPEPVEALAALPDHPPAAFTWRGVRRRVKRADGPERIFGEWWLRDVEIEGVRDYFQVEDEVGQRYWLFRQGDGEDWATGTQAWFMHGLFG